jgi:cation:H+ antiporter
MLAISEWPLAVVVGVFAMAAFIIAIAGVRMTRIADTLADATGLGEAIVGALFLGGSTSLPGITTSVTAAAEGYAELAISNAAGGIAAQTVFLAIADMAHRNINLEHAAASVANLMHGALLTVLLAIPLIAVTGPQVSLWSVHPASVVIIAAYVFGLRLVSKAQTEPMWRPYRTAETRLDELQKIKVKRSKLVMLWLRFAVLAVVVGFAGYVVAQAGATISNRTGISETVVGGLLTAIATSLPELVTSVSAVRQGALTLAVGGIIGGNCFDVLFVSFSDFAYREGSIYAALTAQQSFMIALSILLTGVLLLGLLRREKRGIGNIGFESFLIIVVYLLAFAFLIMKG